MHTQPCASTHTTDVDLVRFLKAVKIREFIRVVVPRVCLPQLCDAHACVGHALGMQWACGGHVVGMHAVGMWWACSGYAVAMLVGTR